MRPPAKRCPSPPRPYRVRKAITVNGETVVCEVTVCPPGRSHTGPDWLSSLSMHAPSERHARAVDAARQEVRAAIELALSERLGEAGRQPGVGGRERSAAEVREAIRKSIAERRYRGRNRTA